MTEKEITLTTLRQEKRKIDEKIYRLKDERNAIDKTISYLMGDTQLQIMDAFRSVPRKTIGPTEAIRDLFNQYPQKKWLPGRLRDELKDLKKNGELKTESENLLSAVHWILRAFVERGDIEKRGHDKIKWYRKINVED